MSAFTRGLRALFARDPKPATSAGEIVSVEAGALNMPRGFGGSGIAFPRMNPDELAGRKGLAIYAKMRLDEQVKAVVTFKRDAILSRGWTFEWSEENEEALPESERALRLRVFQNIVRALPGSFIDCLNIVCVGREYGFSMTEKVYGQVEVDGKTYVGLQALLGRDPSSFNFYTDEYGSLERCEQMSGGRRIDIDLPKFIHYIHNPEFDRYFGRSDLREAYRAWFMKDVFLKAWANYVEKLGGGMIIGKITVEAGSAYREGSAELAALRNAVANARNTAGLVMPAGVDIEVVFPTSTNAYKDGLEYHDLSIAKALLVPNLMGVSHAGQTGSYSQSQTQLESFAWTVKADTERLEECINEQLFRDLGDQNFGDGMYPRFVFKPLSTEALRWLVTTWSALAGAGVVIPTEKDEARLREILEMPPRAEDDKTLAEKKMELMPQPIGMPSQNGAPEGTTATAIARTEGREAPREEMRRHFHLESQHDQKDHGQRGDGDASEFKPELKRAANYKVTGEYEVKLPNGKTTRVTRNAGNGGRHPPGSWIELTDHNNGAGRLLGFNKEEALQELASLYGAKKMRRTSFALAAERVDFAVIGRRQDTMAKTVAHDAAMLVTKAITRLVSDDALARYATDPSTIANVELQGVDVGRLKVMLQKALADAWALGRQHAQLEVRRTGKRFKRERTAAEFADLRDTAAQFFEANGFRMAGNVADAVRALLQLELQNSVKYGRSPGQTREAIWTRLVSRGFSSREAVRTLIAGGPDEDGIQQALDALDLETEEQAAHYLDTLARTNLFEAMNEARYAEFTDPALDGFVVAFRYSAILDERTTTICEHLHDKVFNAKSEVWDEYRPPNHYNCRSVLVPITQLDVQSGDWDEEESAEPTVEPQEGFK